MRVRVSGGWRTVLVGVLVLALIGGGVWAVFFSRLLVAEHVTVTGNRELTRRQVVDAAGVRLGRPLARQDVGAIARRTRTLPPVETATAARKWPRTIEISVVERRPVLAVRQVDGYVLVDRHGVSYQPTRSIPNGVVLTDANPGNRPLLREVAVVGSALPGSLRKKTNSLAALDANRITLILKSGVRVNWGSSADSPLKADIVMALLKRNPKASIDVSSPHNPAAR